MQKKLLAILISLPGLALADEGMWTLDNLPQGKMEAAYGFKPDAGWVKKAMQSSARMAGGCSASFISKDGLIMTNHHCVEDCLEQISSEKKNYLKDGFHAKTRKEELVCPAMEMNRLEEIRDVTAQVMAATAGLSGTAYQQAQNAVRATLTSACVGADKATVRCDLVNLYHGGQYHLYKYHKYTDTRIVWAPEKASASFGGDPDNFNFPRYDLDMGLIRVYENGKPASIGQHFSFSKNGAQEGEMVFVTGHPGRTQRQLTVAQLMSLRDIGLIDRLLRLSELRGVVEQYRTSGPEAERVGEGLINSVENGYKALYGELQTLLDPQFIQRKQSEEQALRQFVAGKPELQARIGGAWDAIEKAQIAYRQQHKAFSFIEGGAAFMGMHFHVARMLVRAAQEKTRPNAERLPEYADSRLPMLEQELLAEAPVYPDFEKVQLNFSLTKAREILGSDHPFVKQVLGNASPEQLAGRMIRDSKLADVGVRKALWEGGLDAIQKSDDPFIRLALAIDTEARALRRRFEDEVTSVISRNSELVAQARFAQTGTDAYPDATFTLRLSYGKVRGWNEAGKPVAPFADFGGAFARETGAAPFALPASWHAAKSRLNLKQPFNFVSDNDIIGGNSGSPMINRKGEIVGLVFDGNIHSLGGAFWFDPGLNRTVAVHSGGIMEALEKIYGAHELIREIRGQ